VFRRNHFNHGLLKLSARQDLHGLKSEAGSISYVSSGKRWNLDKRSYFGSIEKAKDALRTDKRLANRWSKQKILNIIAKRIKGDNRRVTVWRKNPALVSATAKRFGTWRQAVKVAGVTYERRK
jgi:hypothetical protein